MRSHVGLKSYFLQRLVTNFDGACSDILAAEFVGELKLAR